MSYDVSLTQDGGVVTVSRHSEGATYAVGGLPYAEMSVTYNYAKLYGETIMHNGQTGLRALDGSSAAVSLGALATAIAILGTERDPDYWKATPGNAGYALWVMYNWARLYPNAVWDIH